MTNQTLPLWPSGAPGALGAEQKDIPTLTKFPAERHKDSGASFLVLPGGGYAFLAPHEGEAYARWLSGLGVTAYVLAYRLGSSGYRHPAMWMDASRGLRTVRSLARREGRDPARVGVIGSSAGGHLASTLLVYNDEGDSQAADPVERESSRPDLGVLCYPLISGVAHAHQASFTNLLGDHPSQEALLAVSTERHVNGRTPPTFLWHTVEDAVVDVENSLLFAGALRRAGVPFELHIYERGAHGLGLPSAGGGAPPWDVELARWLRERGFIA